ncbi:major facilitator superfamily domain-containing protein [Podospora aff. communis PSN243]|uniref:Major facilitator superfamily domain-containing protein n=1 Tax=Podospora aff. communis PSN243 TaxID=3040156 RepID=A0AAV9GH05_9PEZI|nr:major facilitator superfamily domain-containing protein [Podospora aff. communis PSN243]
MTSWHSPSSRAWIIIAQLAGINLITSFSSGLITVGLPAIAADLLLDDSLLVWPVSVYSLTSGTCLLLAGSVADVVGPRPVNLAGCFFLAVFMAACGFSQTGIQLIMFRAIQGVASALVVPSSISIVSTAVESGRPRNLGFSCLGLAMPAGFALGLVLGGVFISGPGWRVGYYFGGAVAFLLWMVGIWALPAVRQADLSTPVSKRLAQEVDWVGAAMASTCLATLAYVLAMLSADISEIGKPTNIGLLFVSALVVPAFIFWMKWQERTGKAALIPNSIWKNRAFSSVCVMILLSIAVMNCMELFCSLFFQEVQGLSALDASLRLLPNLLFGVVINLVAGFIVHRVPAMHAVLISSGLCAGAPLIMALINPAWPYWYAAFVAQILAPMSGDVLFTVGLIIVSDVFPVRTQALAGAVFNTLSQLGVSIGLTTMSVISASATQKSGLSDKHSPGALMEGYRAAFWTLFAWMVGACLVGAFGLRKVGKVGLKKD